MRSSRRGNLLLRNPLARGECAIRILFYKTWKMSDEYRKNGKDLSYIGIEKNNIGDIIYA